MKNWKDLMAEWETLSLRDKRRVAGGCAAATVTILYLFIWSPITHKIDTLQIEIEQNKKLLTWMQSADTKIQFLEKQLKPASASSSKSLLSLIQSEISQTTFAKNLTGLQQTDKNAVQFNLKNVVFDNVMTWLIQLWKQHGIQITQMSTTPTGESGIVTIEIALRN